MESILVIEDEINIAETIQDILELKGYSVKTAPDGLAGLMSVIDEPPDLVLCDVMMPRMTGHEVLKAIRRNPTFKKPIPFIFLTAKGERGDFRDGMDLGADDYLIKPIQAEKLYQVIENSLVKFKARIKAGHIEESERISQDLHDTLQQTLLGLFMKLRKFRDKGGKFTNLVEIDESLEYIDLAFKQLQLILKNSDLFLEEEIDFVTGLEHIIQRVSGFADFEIHFQNELVQKIPPQKARVLFKVILEIFNNAIKYSQAGNFFIKLGENGTVLNLIIQDDGLGFDISTVQRGHGLYNIADRVERIGGASIINSSPGKGTEHVISFTI